MAAERVTAANAAAWRHGAMWLAENILAAGSSYVKWQK